MTRIFWDVIFLISGSLFTFGAGPGNSTIIEADISINTNSSAAPSVAPSSSEPSSSSSMTTSQTNVPPDSSSIFTFGAEPTIVEPSASINVTAANASTSSSETNSSVSSVSTTTTTTYIPPVKKFVAAAVRSHFDDCPDSHRHFCFHGTCRFLILEETPACVCHPGFMGMRCEHADLLAVVATNHRQQTVATVLVLCVIGCVLVMLLCTLLHCWWRQECRRRRYAHHYVTEKPGASCYPTESVV